MSIFKLVVKFMDLSIAIAYLTSFTYFRENSFYLNYRHVYMRIVYIYIYVFNEESAERKNYAFSFAGIPINTYSIHYYNKRKAIN